MPTIYVDSKPYEVKQGQSLLQACLSLGFNLPYFCWHPAMHSVGACRQCAVKLFRDETDTKGRIVMSCMTPAADGARISIDDPEARKARASVIEWLMLNHPHDCPVCDEGGECHLQDMTVMTGHVCRRTRFPKRTHKNQDLGPFINHELNRCIQCYRCVRFYNDYAGGRDFGVFACHDHVYFGRHREGTLESEFSGNLVEVCPTGVFTDKTFKHHYTRTWDLQTAPSVCVHCSVGCNTFPGERYGTLRRIRNRFHSEVNGYFLCDRGRYGYEFVNSSRRIRRPLLRSAGHAQGEIITREAAVAAVAEIIREGRGAIGIGSPRASLEANFALLTLVGIENFYAGVPEEVGRLTSQIAAILMEGPARSPCLSEVARADAVLLLGEDVSNTAPMAALALRKSVRVQPMETIQKLHIPEWDDAAVRKAMQERKGPLFIASPHATRLDAIAAKAVRAAPDDLARLGHAVARRLNGNVPKVAGLSVGWNLLSQEIAAELKRANRPLVISGTGLGSKEVIRAAANVAWALSEGGKEAGLFYVVPECNSLGLGLLGGGAIGEALKAVQNGAAETVIVLENDLFRYLEPARAAQLCAVKHLVAIDHLANETTVRAQIVLPAAPFAESEGTMVNSEGRAQRFIKVFPPPDEVQESWRWLGDIIAAAKHPEGLRWEAYDQVTAALTEALPVFKPLLAIAPPAWFRIAGMKVPRQPHRYSGRTSMLAHVSVHEPKPVDDPDTPLSFSMEGYGEVPPPPLISRYWAPGWNSVQALGKFQSEVGGPLRGGDPGKRLIEPIRDKRASYFAEIPRGFKARRNEWLAVPLYHVFGSEELSIITEGVAERAPGPYLALNPDDAKGHNAEDGEEVRLTAGNGEGEYRLPLKLDPSLPHGLAGIPVGLAGGPPMDLPAWIGIAFRKKEVKG